jgi:HSP20 family protein
VILDEKQRSQYTQNLIKNFKAMLVKFNHPLARRKDFFADEFFTRDFDKLFKGVENKFIPAVNIKENEAAFELELSVPGFKKEDFNLKLDNNLLTISAKVEDKTTETTEKFTRREFKSRSFSRTFTLSDDVLVEAINAKYEDGILKVELPKNKEVIENKQKRIEVK